MLRQFMAALRLHSILVDVQGIHLILRRRIRGEIGKHQERLAVAEQPLHHRLRIVRTMRREKAGIDEIDRRLQLGIVIELAPWLISGRAPARPPRPP